MKSNIITLTGDLGSGKSTVSRILSETIHAERYSVGSAQRQVAQSKGISILELARMAEQDTSIDRQIDAAFSSLQDSSKRLIVDARMAWHFIPDAINIKLIVSPIVAAQRVHNDPTRVSEEAETVEATLASIQARRESEKKRFFRAYGVDSDSDEHFDYVIDTTAANPDEVVTLLKTLIETPEPEQDNKLWICTKNLFPSEHVCEQLPAKAGSFRLRQDVAQSAVEADQLTASTPL